MNRKTHWGLLAVLIITTTSVLHININTNENGLSDISLNNIEALAQEAGGPECQPSKGYCTNNGIKSEQSSFK